MITLSIILDEPHFLAMHIFVFNMKIDPLTLEAETPVGRIFMENFVENGF